MAQSVRTLTRLKSFSQLICASAQTWKTQHVLASPKLPRTICTTPFNALREVTETVEGNVTTIEGEYVDSVRKESIAELPKHPIPGTCLLCELNVNYTDVLILNQFIRPDGQILPKEVTGLCSKKHLEVERLLHQAKQAGLLPNRRALHEDEVESQHMSQYKWKKYNVYFTPGKRYQTI